jgi:hypothetical protein
MSRTIRRRKIGGSSLGLKYPYDGKGAPSELLPWPDLGRRRSINRRTILFRFIGQPE